MIQPKQIELTFDEVIKDNNYTNVAHVKIKDPRNGRWTDCWLAVTNTGHRVKFLLSHEKGYPSENKGIAEKEITASWLSNELPVV